MCLLHNRAAGLIAALVVLYISAAEAGRDLAQESPNVETSGCSPPPVGIWQVVHNFPNLPGDSTLFPQARTTLTMTTGTIPGVYTGGVFAISAETSRHAISICCLGSGGGIVTNPDNPLFPPDSPLVYTFVGIFNEELCAITGTTTDLLHPVVDTFVWYYDGNVTMSGPYVIRTKNTLPFTTLSRQDLQYLSSS